MRLHGQWLTEDDLNKCSTKHTNKYTLVARGADTQLGSTCVLAPLATNVDLWNPIALNSFYIRLSCLKNCMFLL